MATIRSGCTKALQAMLFFGGGMAVLPLCMAPAFAQTGKAAGSSPRMQSEAPDTLAEVLVTAQKRQQSLQDVPISITVLSGATLDATNQSLVEELGRVPGVATVGASLGGTFISLRGVGATGTNFAGTGTVGYYLDSVPFGFVRNALTPDSNAYDLERVEVLRGPQGTLYGVNSQVGVIRVITKEADLDEFEAKYRVGLSSTDSGGQNYRGDAAINAPLVKGKLAARFVVGYEDFDGWIDRPNHADANGAERFVLRGKLNAQPTEKLSLGLSAWHSQLDSDANSAGLDDRTTTILADEPLSEDYDVYALRAEYDFGGVSLSSVTGYMDFVSESLTDFTYGPATNLTTSEFASTVLSQEVNLASKLEGPWQWTAGAIYRDVEDRFAQLSPRYANPRGNRYNDHATSFAVFAEVTRRMLHDTLELTGGLRYYEDRTRTVQLSALGNPNATLINSRAESEKTSPRIVLTWLPNDHFTLYGSYSEGFRGGFPQSPTVKALAPGFPAVGPDNLLSYEIGSKGSFANNLISYDAAVFFIDYRGIQQSIQVLTANGAGAPIRVSGLINGESASGWGTELGLTIRPAQGLSFGVNYAWNGLTLDADIVPANGIPLFYKGDRLTNSPEHTANAWFDQSFPLGSFDGYVSGSVSYVSERQTRGLVNGVRSFTASDDTLTSRLSAGLRSPRGWGLSLFVDNLNNYNGSPIPEAFVPPSGSYRIRPRTIGLQFEQRF
ncbi:MAG: TonB-dependent receptor [Steroidobacteraceae bacterium]